MRTKIEIKEIKIYEFAELKDNIKNDVIHNFLIDGYFNYILDEFTDTLEGLAKFLGGDLDYSLSLTPDKGDFIKIKGIDSDFLKKFKKIKESYPFTGLYYDDRLIDLISQHGLEYALDEFIHCLHKEVEYWISHEVFKEHCKANQYEFLENGELV